MVRAAAIVSGNGAELQNLLDGLIFGEIADFSLAALVATEAESPALRRGDGAHIPVYTVDAQIFPNPETYTRALTAKLLDLDIDAAIAVTLSPEPGREFYRAFAGRCICLRISEGGSDCTATALLADADGSEVRRFGRVRAEKSAGADPRRGLIESGAGELLTDAVKQYMREYHG